MGVEDDQAGRDKKMNLIKRLKNKMIGLTWKEKKQLGESLRLLKDKLDNTNQVRGIVRLWVLWNAKVVTSDEFASKVGKILDKETTEQWQLFIKSKTSEQDDPLEALFI